MHSGIRQQKPLCSTAGKPHLTSVGSAGKLFFGANKTWRGLVFGSFIGALTGLLIAIVYPPSASAVGIAPLLPKASMALLGGLLGSRRLERRCR